MLTAMRPPPAKLQLRSDARRKLADMDNHHGDNRVAPWRNAPPGAQEERVEASTYGISKG